jgi:hypothetical protein
MRGCVRVAAAGAALGRWVIAGDDTVAIGVGRLEGLVCHRQVFFARQFVVPIAVQDGKTHMGLFNAAFVGFVGLAAFVEVLLFEARFKFGHVLGLVQDAILIGVARFKTLFANGVVLGPGDHAVAVAVVAAKKG